MHVGEHAAVERCTNTEARLIDIEAPDDGGVPALEHADDAPLEALSSRPALDAHDDAIAVHRLFDVRRGDVDIGRVAACGLSGTTKPKPAALVVKRPTTRSIFSGSPKRLPLICTTRRARRAP